MPGDTCLGGLRLRMGSCTFSRKMRGGLTFVSTCGEKNYYKDHFGCSPKVVLYQGSPVIALFSFQDPTLSWTDDLPVCHQSGVGFATNQIYREDGFRREEHDFEDRSIHFR